MNEELMQTLTVRNLFYKIPQKTSTYVFSVKYANPYCLFQKKNVNPCRFKKR